MRLRLALAACVAAALPAPAAAQQWHHVHLRSTDAQAARAWYIEHMGTEPRGATNVRMGGTAINLWERDAGFPPSSGGVLDHIGFSVEDIEATMARLEAAGVEIVRDVFEVFGLKVAFVRDPWGTTVEIAQDHDRLGFQHVHAYVSDPEAAVEWFVTMFGGTPTPFLGRVPSVDYEETWIMFSPAGDRPRAPSEGRSFDHIGFTVDDMEATLERLGSLGVEVTEGPRPSRSGTATVAYVAGPDGIRIELLEPGR